MKQNGHTMQTLNTIQEDNDRDGQKQPVYQRVKNFLLHILWVVVFRKSEAFLFLFAVIAGCLLFGQFIVFLTYKPRDPLTSHWKKAYLGGKITTAPAIVYQHAKYRGFGMPIYHNISDLSQYHFRDVSSIKVAKGVTVTLFSEPEYQGSEISIDHDATYIGDRFNDQSFSLAITIDPVEPHDVQVYRTGASLGLHGAACPERVECSPAVVLEAVSGSVYMARNRMMLDFINPKMGCTVSHFTHPNGQRIYGMLPPRVHAVCLDENFILPAEAPGHRVEVANPSLQHRIQVETALTMPRVLRVRGLLGQTERDALMALARPQLAKSESNVGLVAEFAREKAGTGWTAKREIRGVLKGDELLAAHGKEAAVGRIVWVLADTLSMVPDRVDSLQVRCLGEGEEEKMHREWVNSALPPSHPDASRNRLVTAFILLTDAEEGGEMRFTTDATGATSKVEGAPGDVLFMYNLMAQGQNKGQPDPLAAYAMSPVTAGEKCMAVVHFYNRLRFQDQYNSEHHVDKHRAGSSKGRPHSNAMANMLGRRPT